MSELPSSPSPSGHVSGSIAGAGSGASAASSPPVRARASSPGQKRPVEPPLGWGGRTLLVAFGILLPVATIASEVVLHWCAETLFDPIPTWWHLALVCLVPGVNVATLFAVERGRTAWLRPLAHLNAAAVAIAMIYAGLFLPITPFALIGIILGVGLLALAPLLSVVATLQVRGALRRANGDARALPRFWPGFLAGTAALVLPHAHTVVTQQAMAMSATGDAAATRQPVAFLRTFGSRETMLRACYGVRDWMDFVSGWGVVPFSRASAKFSREDAQKVYYRVTGVAFNTVPAPTGASLGRQGRGRWNFDAALGGSKVADRVPGLSMSGSRLDGKIDAAAGTSYVEWTMVFKNVAANPSEARAQFELPPGGVVSRLTLWIDGEPREAAFGGRGQVRAAYQEVAVQQRRDPVLVTTAGPDRVLMQCFPVPANGGEMKVRVGITAPLRLRDERQAELLLPRMLEVNFEQAGGFAHEVWFESDAPLEGTSATARLKLGESELRAGRRLPVQLPAPAGERWTDDPGDPHFLIRQTVRRAEAGRPSRVAFAIDGSKHMAPELRRVAETLRKLPTGLEFTLVFAGDEPEIFGPSTDAAAGAAWLAKRRATGGRDNLPALERAWDTVATQAGGAVVWLHGPQPVLLAGAESMLQRTERERTPPALYDLAATAGPNRIVEQLDRFRGLRSVRLAPFLAENLAQLLARWRGEASDYEFIRERLARSAAPAEFTPGTKHIARLWGLDEIERLRAEPSGLDRAIKLALQLQLVTPVSGAVVLERKEQYDRHGLDPADPNSVPTVPEPTAALLAILGAGALLLRRHRRG